MSGLNPGVIGSMIPIVASVAGAAIALVVLWFRHRERIATIAMGMHPDAKDPDELESEEADELEPSRRLRGSADRYGARREAPSRPAHSFRQRCSARHDRSCLIYSTTVLI